MKTSQRLTTAILVFLAALGVSAQGTFVGTIANSNGLGIANGTITETLSQAAYIPGSFAVATNTISCYTGSTSSSQAGSILGLPDPRVALATSVNYGSGSLPSGTYYIQYSYIGTSTETLPSPEFTATMASSGTLTITAPSIRPASAIGWKVYIGTTSGGEHLQATQGTWPNYAQSVALSGSTVPTTTNNTVCKFYFNDSVIPTYTTYNMNVVDGSGNQVRGYPQNFWFAGSVVNVSNLTPAGNISAKFPTAIIASPSSGAMQSINGSLTIQGNEIVTGTLSVTGTFSAARFFSNNTGNLFGNNAATQANPSCCIIIADNIFTNPDLLPSEESRGVSVVNRRLQLSPETVPADQFAVACVDTIESGSTGTINGEMKPCASELYILASGVTVNQAQNYQATFVSIAGGSLVNNWSGYIVNPPGQCTNCIVNGGGILIGNMLTSPATIQNPYAIHIQGIGTAGQIKWTGTAITENPSNYLSLQAASGILTNAGLTVGTGGSQGVSAGSYAIGSTTIINNDLSIATTNTITGKWFIAPNSATPSPLPPASEVAMFACYSACPSSSGIGGQFYSVDHAGNVNGPFGGGGVGGLIWPIGSAAPTGNYAGNGNGTTTYFLGTLAGTGASGNPIAFATNALEAMRIDVLQRVMIGTTTPLSDGVNLALVSIVAPAGQDSLILNSSLSSNANFFAVYAHGNTTGFKVLVDTGGGLYTETMMYSSGPLYIRSDDGIGTFVNPAQIAFTPNNVTAMVINQTKVIVGPNGGTDASGTFVVEGSGNSVTMASASTNASILTMGAPGGTNTVIQSAHSGGGTTYPLSFYIDATVDLTLSSTAASFGVPITQLNSSSSTTHALTMTNIGSGATGLFFQQGSLSYAAGNITSSDGVNGGALAMNASDATSSIKVNAAGEVNASAVQISANGGLILGFTGLTVNISAPSATNSIVIGGCTLGFVYGWLVTHAGC